jgi:DNA-binding Lrp family transcriptional regulator
MVSNQKHCIKLQGEITGEDVHAKLKPSDQVVLKYLDELTMNNDGETCTASIPKIASTCDISERQVQISTKRLIDAGLLKRIGYDFSNPDREKRGTVFKVITQKNGTMQSAKRRSKKRSVKFLLIWSED